MKENVTRLGLYAWGGPGTAEMMRVKHGAWGMTVDDASFLRLYDDASLDNAASLGVTDMWVTYSWGFGDSAEQAQRQYLRSRLPAFRQRGIATHAYVQGPNRVVRDCSRALFCTDGNGRLLPYSAGRAMLCTNNPEGMRAVLERVQAACSEDCDGVFMDNMLYGAPPAYIRKDFATFFGCACHWCRELFAREYGYPLPLRERKGERQVADCVRMRCDSLQRLVAAASDICKAAGKTFGVNLFDPVWHDPATTFGYALSALTPHCSYLLFENHALAGEGNVSNAHLLDVIRAAGKPAFIVSYRKGIGCDTQWSQRDIDALAHDAQAGGYYACIKASEYVRKRTWHAADLSAWSKPQPPPKVRQCNVLQPKLPLPASTLFGRMAGMLGARLQQRFGQALFELPLPRLVPRRQLIAWMCRRRQRYVYDATRERPACGTRCATP